MAVFDLPVVWELHTTERVEAKDVFEAESKMLHHCLNGGQPKSDPSTWRIEPQIDCCRDVPEKYPIPEPPDPMKGWDCKRTPGPYEGGYWVLETEDGYMVEVIGDDGPIDVGWSLTTYTFRISHERLGFNIESKQTWNDKAECRDEAFAMLKNVRKI